MNLNFRLCNRLHNFGNRLPAVNKCFNSNFKSCNRLHKSCNRLPDKTFRKIILRVTTSQKAFSWPPMVYIYVIYNTNLRRVFQNSKCLFSQRAKSFILLRIPWPIQLQFIKELFECLICKIHLFLERFFLLLLLIL